MNGHEAYFNKQAERSNSEFWTRFGSRPDFAGKRVLDLGCGHGAMSLEAARDGADVLGVDLDVERIDWAQANVPGMTTTGTLDFCVGDVTEMGFEDEFDLILSKDTFEHIADMNTMLQTLHRALKPGGQIWAGFSPLYYSPWGDHGRTGLRVPWAHTLPLPLVLALASRIKGHHISSLDDLGLNGLTLERFRGEVAAADLRFRSLKINQGDKPLLKTLDVVRRFHPLEKYATVSIYTVMESAA